jgi:hypothetical protein
VPVCQQAQMTRSQARATIRVACRLRLPPMRREGQPGGDRPARDRDEHDLLGAIGGRADRVRGEHCQGDQFAEPLVHQPGGRQRPAEQRPLESVAQRLVADRLILASTDTAVCKLVAKEPATGRDPDGLLTADSRFLTSS